MARGACYVIKLYPNLLCDLFTNTSSYQSFQQIALKALFGVTLITFVIFVKSNCFVKFKFFLKVLYGNHDSETVVYNVLVPPITARLIRVLPVEWHSQISMRLEIYGCPGINYKIYIQNIFGFLGPTKTAKTWKSSKFFQRMTSCVLRKIEPDGDDL